MSNVMETMTRIDGIEIARCGYCRYWFEMDEVDIDIDGKFICVNCDDDDDDDDWPYEDDGSEWGA
jgi:hypothetical protein